VISTVLNPPETPSHSLMLQCCVRRRRRLYIMYCG